MRSIHSIQRDFRRKSESRRMKMLENEIESMTDVERERYNELYRIVDEESRKTGLTISVLVRILDRRGFFISPVYVSTEYAIACVATGNPVRNLPEVLKNNKPVRKYKLSKEETAPIFDKTASPGFSRTRSHSAEQDYNE